MKRALYRTAKSLFNAVGLDVVKKGQSRTLRERMQRIKDFGFAPRTILDGGAFHGLWSKEAAAKFPGAQLVVVEPNQLLLATIERNLSHLVPKPEIVNAALGQQRGRARFNIWKDPRSDQGASLLDHVSGEAARIVDVSVETLDDIAEKTGHMPDLVKLDLQGAELPAIRGGTSVLKNAEVAIVEFGCLEAYIGRTTPRELLDAMYERAFRLYDVVDLHDRPYDGALAGGDMFFVKESSSLLAHKGWD